MKNYLPFGLVWFRLFLAPTLIWLTLHHASPWVLFAVLLAAILSDLFDGVIARRLNVASEALRRFDSQTDLVFWICACYSAYRATPDLIFEHRYYLFWLIFLEVLCYAVSFARFKKEPCTHCRLAKYYAGSLFIALVSLLCFKTAGIPFYNLIFAGTITNFDVILILLFLPKWDHDIPSSYHAWQMRKKARLGKTQG